MHLLLVGKLIFEHYWLRPSQIDTLRGETCAAFFGVLSLSLTLGALFAWQWCKQRRHNAEGRIRQIITKADQHRRAGSNPPAPAQAVLSLAEGIDSTSHSKSSGSIVPRVPPFKFPHRIVRAQERAMSVSPLFTGDGTSTALAEGGQSRVGATNSSSRWPSASFSIPPRPRPLCRAPRTLHRARSNITFTIS